MVHDHRGTRRRGVDEEVEVAAPLDLGGCWGEGGQVIEIEEGRGVVVVVVAVVVAVVACIAAATVQDVWPRRQTPHV